MDRGVDGVAVEALARSLGVTKGSFYWHFEDRDDLLQALLTTWESEGTRRIIEWVEQEAEDPASRLAALVYRTSAVTDFDRLEGALRSWARTEERARVVVQRVDRRRLGYVTSLLVASGIGRAVARRRAEIFYRTLIGEFTYRSLGGRRLSKRALDDVIAFLLMQN